MVERREAEEMDKEEVEKEEEKVEVSVGDEGVGRGGVMGNMEEVSMATAVEKEVEKVVKAGTVGEGVKGGMEVAMVQVEGMAGEVPP
ncbi:hypothetical protein CYMTET_50256 [Cymbomonas tetramitiformis]|uniref:Uncharacterized protein n=1 Tax=Cymbomonas tetramitiformis TaxID=36881 RepID=A0AAE0BQ56_9CHLO|nr:hypothetical protein CYMTET_50256 [Cymbomonas tetramitiformis]